MRARTRLVALDVDGVLIDAREIHYRAFNDALDAVAPGYSLGRDEHVSAYDGLPTRRKLDMLTRTRGLPEALHDRIDRAKQDATLAAIAAVPRDERLVAELAEMRRTWRLAAVSNARRETVALALKSVGASELIDHVVSQETSGGTKPSWLPYAAACKIVGVSPAEAVAVEDSPPGIRSAESAGVRCMQVHDPSEVSLASVEAFVADGLDPVQVVVPMAGSGERFKAKGYREPKPFIDAAGETLVGASVRSLGVAGRHTFVVRDELLDAEPLAEPLLRAIGGGAAARIVRVGRTDGAACTALIGARSAKPDGRLVIANCDQVIGWDSRRFFHWASCRGADAAILTFKGTGKRWSYSRADAAGRVLEVAEKREISDDATCGVYYWRRASDFESCTREMIAAGDRTNGEFYVCPAFNYAVLRGLKVYNYPVDEMHGIGTPEDLEEYVASCA